MSSVLLRLNGFIREALSTPRPVDKYFLSKKIFFFNFKKASWDRRRHWKLFHVPLQWGDGKNGFNESRDELFC